ncbi:YgjV family protein, partial [Pseudoalteromonas sp. B5MOD-1]
LVASQPSVRQQIYTHIRPTIGWIVHNILVFSPLAVVMETVFLISNLVGLWRFYAHPKPA